MTAPVKPDDMNKPTAILLQGHEIARLVGHLNYAITCYQDDGKFIGKDSTQLVEDARNMKERLMTQV